MRLWTFQAPVCLEDLNEHGIWYSTSADSKRIKPIDRQYCVNVNVKGEEVMTAPIYCFSRLCGYSSLPLRAVGPALTSLNGIYSMHLYNGYLYMYELEVPESEMISIKMADDSFWDHDPNMPRDLSPDQMAPYRIMVRTDQIYYDDFLRHNREAKNDMEVLVPYIKKEWLVCYRMVASINHEQYLTHKFVTYVVDKDKFPSWEEDLWMRCDKLMRVPLVRSPRKEDDLKCLSRSETDAEIKSKSMKGCPGYYTLAESLNSCNTRTVNLIVNRLNELGITEDKYWCTTISDLFPDGLSAERVDELS